MLCVNLKRKPSWIQIINQSESKYSLIKNEDSLNEQQQERLNNVLEVSPILAKVHALKEEFRDIFESTKSQGESIINLLDWMHDGMKYFPKSIGTMVRQFGEVVGYFDDRTTSVTVEGINHKLKLIKRLGYGFRALLNQGMIGEGAMPTERFAIAKK